MFAYGVGEGAVSWLSYAFRLMQLPIGVFGVAVATVTLPALVARGGRMASVPDFRPTLAKGLRLVAFLVLPSTIGLVLLWPSRSSACFTNAGPSMPWTACKPPQPSAPMDTVSLCYAWLKVLQPAFYAIDKRWLPMIVSIFALGLNLGFNWFFVFVMRWGHESLALTTSITATVNFLILFIAMRKFAGDFGTLDLLDAVRETGAGGCAMMAGVCLACHPLFLPGSRALVDLAAPRAD
jgi:putative peptidoglycan lipid II flippase